MEFGPIQLIAIGFNDNDHLYERIACKLDTIRRRGGIRLIDALVVTRESNHKVRSIEARNFNSDETPGLGAALQQLIGKSDEEQGARVIPDSMIAAGIGITHDDIASVVRDLRPGSSMLCLLIEHDWLTGLRHAIRGAGGYPIIHGFLTTEEVVKVESQLESNLKNKRAIESAEVVNGAALLDAMITMGTVVETAEVSGVAADSDSSGVVGEFETATGTLAEVRAAAVAETIRTLILANRFDETAVERAFAALIAAGVFQAATLQAAIDSIRESPDHPTATPYAVRARSGGHLAEGSRDRKGLAATWLHHPDNVQSHGPSNGG